jgi:hypothetical protein
LARDRLSLLALFGAGNLEGCPHQPTGLLLFFGQFVHHILEFVVAAPLHLLLVAKHLLDGRVQRLRTVDDEQVFAVRRQPPVAQTGEQLLYGAAAAFSVAPEAIPKTCLWPSRSTPTALRM